MGFASSRVLHNCMVVHCFSFPAHAASPYQTRPLSSAPALLRVSSPPPDLRHEGVNDVTVLEAKLPSGGAGGGGMGNRRVRSFERDMQRDHVAVPGQQGRSGGRTHTATM